MKSFKDTKGRQWSVAVTVGAVRRVKALLDVDLMTIGTGNTGLARSLAVDPLLLVDVLFVLLKPDADAAGVTDEEFGSAMGGTSLDDATDAFMEELADFFPKGQREVLRTALAKMRDGQARAAEMALAEMEKLDVGAILANASTRGDSSGSTPASSASTPNPEPSAS